MTPATRARIQAERDLAEKRAQLERVRAETPRHQALGERLRAIRATNHIAEAFNETFRGS